MKPWTSGPRELLNHALEHIEDGSAFDNRIAFISIDNAVELMIKTYLGLPRRIRKTDGPSRKRLQEATNSFPDLLDLLEEYNQNGLEGIDLGDIEWYHRIRNTLYHEGNGITVPNKNVDAYLQIAKILFMNLFTEELDDSTEIEPKTVLGEIVVQSSKLEHRLQRLYYKYFPSDSDKYVSARVASARLASKGVISNEIAEQVGLVSTIRNQVVHNIGTVDEANAENTNEIMSHLIIAIDAILSLANHDGI